MQTAFSWLDIVIGIILLIYAIAGAQEGFVKSVLRLVVVILSFIAAKILSPKLAQLLVEKTPLYENLLRIVNDKIAPSIEGGSAAQNNLGLFGQLVDSFNKQMTTSAQSISESIATSILNLLSFVAVFIIAWIVLKIIASLLDKVSQLPVLRTFNKAGGMIIGVAKGIIVLIILLNAAYYLNMMLSIDVLSAAFEQSFFMKYLYIDSIISLFASTKQ